MAGSRPAYRYRDLYLDVAIVAVVFAAVNFAVARTSTYFQKERRYHEIVQGAIKRPGLRILFAGDSHFAQPLNGYLDGNSRSSAYSLAFGGDSAREMFAKLQHVVQATAGVNTLVISADPHMFGDGRLESANRSFADEYFIAARDGSGLRSGWIAALLNQVPLFNNDFVQYLRKNVSNSLSRRPSAAAAADASRSDASWQALSDQQRSAMARETGIGDHHGVGEHKEPFYWYSRIFELARARHIRVIGMRLPVHPQYSAQAGPERVAEIDRFMLGEGVTQITDLRDSLSDPRDFDDPDHVNHEGAAKVLKLLEDNPTDRSFAGAFGPR